MNVLKKLYSKVAMIVYSKGIFTDEEIERSTCYSFRIAKGVPQLKKGDFVVVKSRYGLGTAIFVKYSRRKSDYAVTKSNAAVLSKVSDLTIYNYEERENTYE